MLMRRRALDRVGLFDEGYWMYMEDLDLCYRFAEAGWVTWYEPAVTVRHLKAGTSGKHRSPRLNYAFHYGMLRFYRSHYAAERNPLLNAAVYAGIAVKLAAALVRSGLGRPAARRVTPARRRERRADPVDRRRVGAEEPAVEARAGRGRRGSCARADAGR